MEQITERDNNATDTQPIMVRSVRIIQEKDKAPSETSRSEVQPKRSPQSTNEETTLAKGLTPRFPVIEDRDFPGSSTNGKHIQPETDKSSRDEQIQATGCLPHLAPYCIHHPHLNKLMHGSPSDRQ
jgi:hypothetical protein